MIQSIRNFFRLSGKKKQKGAILPLFAIMLLPMLGMAALAMDLGIGYLMLAEMQMAADYASLAGIKAFAGFLPTLDSIRNAAALTAERNQLSMNRNVSVHLERGDGCFSPSFVHNAVAIEDSDIVTGEYDWDTETFVENLDTADPNVNAVQTTIRLGGRNAPFSFKLGRALGLTDSYTNWARNSIATFSTLLYVIASDESNSYDDVSHDSGFPNPEPIIGFCPTVTTPGPYDEWAERNFRSAPLAVDNPTECLSSQPEPIFSATQALRDQLLNNTALFSNFYEISFVTYGTFVSVRQPFGTPNNATDIQNFITTNGLNTWANYAANQNPASFVPGDGRWFPGGDDPLGEVGPSSGYTNIGGVIAQSRRLLNTEENNRSNPVLKVIILISDGAANCSQGGTCTNNASGISQGIQYARNEASRAADDEIVIHTVYFSQTAGGCASEGANTLSWIANQTNGEYTCAASIADLATAFRSIDQRPNFFNVHAE